MVLLELAIGFAIGLSLGLLGGGGSILTVPALVYLLGQSPQSAVTTSLAIVGANSLVGASIHRTQGTLDWTVALPFGSVGMLAAYLSSGISRLLPLSLLLVFFALLMLVVSLLMLARKVTATPDHSARPFWVILVAGAGVGLLTGILGVGGGFLIVPALVLLVGLPMQAAVGTSLVVIAMNSLAGLIGHWGEESLDPILIIIFVLAGLAGAWLGSRLSRRIPAQKLERIFAIFIILLAIFLLVDNVQKLLV